MAVKNWVRPSPVEGAVLVCIPGLREAVSRLPPLSGLVPCSSQPRRQEGQRVGAARGHECASVGKVQVTFNHRSGGQ